MVVVDENCDDFVGWVSTFGVEDDSDAAAADDDDDGSNCTNPAIVDPPSSFSIHIKVLSALHCPHWIGDVGVIGVKDESIDEGLRRE